MEAEGPQGSVVGRLLFNIYIADFPKPKHSKVAQFANDSPPFPCTAEDLTKFADNSQKT